MDQKEEFRFKQTSREFYGGVFSPEKNLLGQRALDTITLKRHLEHSLRNSKKLAYLQEIAGIKSLRTNFYWTLAFPLTDPDPKVQKKLPIQRRIPSWYDILINTDRVRRFVENASQQYMSKIAGNPKTYKFRLNKENISRAHNWLQREYKKTLEHTISHKCYEYLGDDYRRIEIIRSQLVNSQIYFHFSGSGR